MVTIQDKANCSGCHACAWACPKKCIVMKADEEGFLYPAADGDLCVDCGLCERICPVRHPALPPKSEGRVTAYAAVSSDDAVRAESSSGGIFSLLASYVIEQGGVVFGAAFDENFNVAHSWTETREGLLAFRGSKYVQSRMGDAYATAKQMLDAGRLVLFTGTPCQIGGLLAYLKRDYENLITQDIICHGVPAPMVWETYKRYREDAAGAGTARVTFRHKRPGWKTYSVRFEFSNGVEYTERAGNDPYMKAFLNNLSLRPSCYRCAFKGMARVSDITLADFWGIRNLLPDMDDDKGTSLLFLHSEKGRRLFEQIRPSIRCREVDGEQAVLGNPSMLHPAPRPAKRDLFMSGVRSGEDIDGMVRKCCNPGLPRRVINKLRRMLLRK